MMSSSAKRRLNEIESPGAPPMTLPKKPRTMPGEEEEEGGAAPVMPSYGVGKALHSAFATVTNWFMTSPKSPLSRGGRGRLYGGGGGDDGGSQGQGDELPKKAGKKKGGRAAKAARHPKESLNVPEVVTLDNDNDEENQAPSGRQDSAEVEVELEVLAGPKGARGGGLTITPTSAQASANIRPGQILQKLKEKNPGRTNFARNFRNGQPKKSPSPVKAPSSGAPAPVRRPSFKHKAVNHYEKNKDLIRYRMMLEQHRIEGYQPKTAEMPKDFSLNYTPAASFSPRPNPFASSPLFARSSFVPSVDATGRRLGCVAGASLQRSRLSLAENALRKEAFSRSRLAAPGQDQDTVELIDLAKEDESRNKTGLSRQSSSDDDKPEIVSERLVSPPAPFRPAPVKSALPERPKQKQPDDDIVEVLQKYAPSHRRRSTASPSSSASFNSLEKELQTKDVYGHDYLSKIEAKFAERQEDRDRQLRIEKTKVAHGQEQRKLVEASLEKRLLDHLKITEVPLPEPESEEEEVQLPEITPEMEQVVQSAYGSRSTLVDKFNIAISGKDVQTLRGLNWLNDEVINFYLQLICERSKANDNWPNVYAFNTFFYPKLMQSGHAALRRWTRKVDIFSYDIILIPVHLGMHWCLATVDFRKPGVYYYDSMGGNNHKCLTELLKYLQDEHKDKKKTEYSTASFESVIVKDIPQQENGSDCGMFTCKFSEYLSRDADITFTQEDMPYFRKRIVYEIVKADLMHP